MVQGKTADHIPGAWLLFEQFIHVIFGRRIFKLLLQSSWHRMCVLGGEGQTCPHLTLSFLSSDLHQMPPTFKPTIIRHLLWTGTLCTSQGYGLARLPAVADRCPSAKTPRSDSQKVTNTSCPPPSLLPSTHPEGLTASPWVYHLGVALSLYSPPGFPRLFLGTKQGSGGCPGETPSQTGEWQLWERKTMGPGDPMAPGKVSLMGAEPLLTYSASIFGNFCLSRRAPSWVGTPPHSPAILQEDPQVFGTINPHRQSFSTDRDPKRERHLSHPPLPPQGSSHCQGLSPRPPIWGAPYLACFGGRLCCEARMQSTCLKATLSCKSAREPPPSPAPPSLFCRRGWYRTRAANTASALLHFPKDWHISKVPMPEPGAAQHPKIWGCPHAQQPSDINTPRTVSPFSR